MTRFNTPGVRAVGRGPVQTTGERTTTFEGGGAWARTPQGDLFLLAMTNMVGQDTFYEKAEVRDDRFRTLVRTVAETDPAWLTGFIPWLRTEAHMRTAAVVAAAETAHSLIERGVPGARKVIASALQRPDEPGEFLGYWMQAYGRKLPMAVKRGVGDAVIRLYNERSLLKYDTASHGLRFGDVIELTHPGDAKGSAQHLQGAWQGDLFRHAIDRRHNRENGIPASLAMLVRNSALRLDAKDHPEFLLDPDRLRQAGMTWEDALSLGGQHGLDKRRLWEAMIPSMNYMALLRNLRNFDQAGISELLVQYVVTKLTDPDEVERSRQFPSRFVSALKAVQSFRWHQTLETAVNLACRNVPVLPGRTLVLVDVSGSMRATVSDKSGLSRMEVGSLFGAMLASRAGNATLVAFGTQHESFGTPPAGSSVLRLAQDVQGAGARLGWGTNTEPALRATFDGHDQVFVFTDEQSFGGHAWSYSDITNAVPSSTPLFAFNLAGYAPSSLDLSKPNRYALGGFSDKTFTLIRTLLSGRDAKWPWEE